MNNSKTHAAHHPSGHPNKTAVNAENPIFGRPADPIPAVSLQQAAVVQSEKHPRETVQSPLLHEDAASPAPDVVFVSPSPLGTRVVRGHVESPVLPSVAELGAMQAAGEKQTEQAQDSLPSAEDLDAVAAETAAKEATGQIGSGEPETPNVAEDIRFAVGQKVRFTPESGNDTETVYTIDGGEWGQGDDAMWFWHLVEMPGLFLGQNLMPAGPAEA